MRAPKWPRLSKGLEKYRAGQTGLLRLSWDNGDRTVLVNSELGGVTLGWNLLHTAQDELFAAIEGTAFHTRIILERMAEHGTRVDRVINAGGIPQNNPVLNQVYANVLNKPVLVPSEIPTSLGSGIFAMVAAGAFPTMKLRRRSSAPNSQSSSRTRKQQPSAKNSTRSIARSILPSHSQGRTSSARRHPPRTPENRHRSECRGPADNLRCAKARNRPSMRCGLRTRKPLRRKAVFI